MSDFDTLVSLTSSIVNPQIREFTKSFLLDSPGYFRTVPASSSGKYHPKYCLGEGGLVKHTIAATKILKYIIGLKYFNGTLTANDKDRMLSAVILHDTRKQGNSEGHTVKEHEVIAKNAIDETLGIPQSRIGRLVETHMGEWGTEEPKTIQEFLVHLADYLASRKEIEVDVQ